MALRVEYLNHASVLLHLGGVRLLCDPWFEGTAFAGGWGLRYLNPAAPALAATATHLWISHGHSDHLHPPTLRALARERPELSVLVNESADVSLAERLRELGFRRLISLPERQPLPLTAEVTLTRYPSAGIDNMLHVRAPGWSILNCNDCHLRPRALAALRRQLGPVDLLLTHYNHAGKLFDRQPVAAEKQRSWQALSGLVDGIAPRWVIPFAGSHYYRAAESRDQNPSLLDFDELEGRANADPRYVVLRIGDAVSFGAEHVVTRHVHQPPLIAAQEERLEYGDGASWDTLRRAAELRCRALRSSFPLLSSLVGPLDIGVSDQRRVLSLDLRAGVSELPGGPTHLSAHSRALEGWLGRPQGDDSFIAGAHFRVGQADRATLRRWVALSLLHARRLSLRDLASLARTREGRGFLWRRREELLATLLAGGRDTQLAG
ncbi:MAG: MBL fold metallo-hydrolase [Polyangiales bacterium]